MLSNCLFNQVDSIESQILNYEDSKSNIISKAMLLDKFIEGDLQGTGIKDYEGENRG